MDADSSKTGLTLNANGLLNSFTAQASGNFSAEFVQTPEPASSLLLCGAGLLFLRKKQKGQ